MLQGAWQAHPRAAATGARLIKADSVHLQVQVAEDDVSCNNITFTTISLMLPDNMLAPSMSVNLDALCSPTNAAARGVTLPSGKGFTTNNPMPADMTHMPTSVNRVWMRVSMYVKRKEYFVKTALLAKTTADALHSRIAYVTQQHSTLLQSTWLNEVLHGLIACVTQQHMTLLCQHTTESCM